MTALAPYVRIVAQGKGRARSLTQQEAQEAMSIMLSGQAAPEAIGALLMVLRLRGETDAEIAGFTAALRQRSCHLPKVDLDWPSYAAGRSRGAPLFALAAKLVTQAGYRVALHGWNAHQGQGADLRVALDEVQILGEGLVYYPLEQLCPAAFDLLRLREDLGLRSCINTVLRMWNPCGAGASVQGVFHPSYRGLQSRAAALLGDANLTVIKGGGGEFECHPGKAIAVFGLKEHAELHELVPALVQGNRRLHEPAQPVDIAALWSGRLEDGFAVSVIIGTAALALWTLGARRSLQETQQMAMTLWHHRHGSERKRA